MNTIAPNESAATTQVEGSGTATLQNPLSVNCYRLSGETLFELTKKRSWQDQKRASLVLLKMLNDTRK